MQDDLTVAKPDLSRPAPPYLDGPHQANLVMRGRGDPATKKKDLTQRRLHVIVRDMFNMSRI